MLVMGMLSVGYADDPAYDASVTVTGLADGDKVDFYKLIEWVGAQEDGTDVSGWKATSAYATVLTKSVLQDVLIGAKVADQAAVDAGKAAKVGDRYDPTGITAELAGALAKVSASSVGTVKVGDTGSAALDVTAAGLGEGMYMALITPTDADTIYSPVFVSSDYVSGGTNTHEVDALASYGDKAAAKKSTVTLEKAASTTPEDSWDDAKWQTAAIGDTISFTVTSKLPGYGEVYTNPSFVMKDVLTGLKLDAGSVTLVKPAGATATISEAPDGLSYTITFDKDYLRAQTVAQDIEVTYTAKVVKNSTLAVDWEKNEVSIEYSHTPTDENSKLVKKDTTQHYKFTIDGNGDMAGNLLKGKKHAEVVKIGVDANGNPVYDTEEFSEITETNSWKSPLENAEFKLYTNEACTDEYEYHHKNADGTDAGAQTYKSTSDGRIQIANLDAGTYWLKETKAPDGFIMDLAPKKIEIKAYFESVNVTEYWNGTAWITAAAYAELSEEAKADCQAWTYQTDVLDKYEVYINDTLTDTFQFTNVSNTTDVEFVDEGTVELPSPFTNTQGLQLPSTGGIGTTLFYVGGGALILLAVIFLVTKRRMSADE